MLKMGRIMCGYMVLCSFFWMIGCQSSNVEPETVKKPIYFLNTGDSKQVDMFLGYLHSSDPARTTSNQGDYYNNLAAGQYLTGNYQQALEYNNQALAFRMGDEFGTAKSYNNLAVVYQAMGEYTKALELYKQAADMLQRLQKIEWYTYAQHNYTKLQKYLGADPAAGRVSGPPKEDPPILFVE